jgi:hypothetical protein
MAEIAATATEMTLRLGSLLSADVQRLSRWAVQGSNLRPWD